METFGKTYDITPYLGTERGPELMFPRDNETWMARIFPPGADTRGLPEWSLTQEGDLVRVPLLPYRIESRNPPDVFLGMACIMQAVIAGMPKGLRALLIVGDPVEDLSPEHEAFRVWLGVAVLVSTT